jgi:hypothetical protein
LVLAASCLLLALLGLPYGLSAQLGVLWLGWCGLNQLQPLIVDEDDSEDSLKALDQNNKNMAGAMNPMGQAGGLMGAANQGK